MASPTLVAVIFEGGADRAIRTPPIHPLTAAAPGQLCYSSRHRHGQRLASGTPGTIKRVLLS